MQALLFSAFFFLLKVETISNLDEIEKNYPLFAAVNRAANRVDRHQGRIVKLTYEGSGPVTDTLLLVGKVRYNQQFMVAVSLCLQDYLFVIFQ